MAEPSRDSRYQLDEVTRRLNELTIEFHEAVKDFRARFHSSTSDVQALRLTSSALPEFQRRLGEIEKYNLGVIQAHLATLDEEFKWFKRLFYGLLFTIFGTALVAVVTALIRLGGAA